MKSYFKSETISQKKSCSCCFSAINRKREREREGDLPESWEVLVGTCDSEIYRLLLISTLQESTSGAQLEGMTWHWKSWLTQHPSCKHTWQAKPNKNPTIPRGPPVACTIFCRCSSEISLVCFVAVGLPWLMEVRANPTKKTSRRTNPVLSGGWERFGARVVSKGSLFPAQDEGARQQEFPNHVIATKASH